MAGEIALKSLKPDAEKAEAYFERALKVARAQQAKSWGTPRSNEPGTALRAARQAHRSLRPARPDLRLVHEGFDMPDLQDAKILLDALPS